MEPLTTAELRALHALARFETATEAARAAGLSAQTLRNQAYSAYQKLGVNGKTEAFRKIGWLRPPRFMPSATDLDPLRSGFDEPEEKSAPLNGGKPSIHPESLAYLTEGHNARARLSALRTRTR
jgi:DNA-binding CsgD family transcriptional regulator